MKKQKANSHRVPKDESLSSFDLLTEEIVFKILDGLNDDAFALKSFSATCKSFFSTESRHRKTLKPLFCPELIHRVIRRYNSVSHVDFTLCPRVDDAVLKNLSLASKSTLFSLNLSRSRFFTNQGLAAVCSVCVGLVELDLSNATELTDTAAAAVAEAKRLERLRLGRCKLITDMGIGCIAVGCRTLRLLCLRWCVRVSDLGIQLIALKCQELRSLDLSYLPVTEKCLPGVLQLPNLEELVMEGCLGIDDDGLRSLNNTCKTLKTLNISNCQNISHVGLSSLTNGAELLEQLNFAHSSAISPRTNKVTADLASSLSCFPNLKSIKFDGCVVTCSGLKAIGTSGLSLTEMSLSKCTGVTDEALSFLVQSNKGLKKLDITCCTKITYKSIDAIMSSCTSLVSLRMESCRLVPKEVFVLFGQQRCPFLEDLDVTDNEIDNEGLKSISCCSRISSLKLGICCNIDDDGIAYIAEGCSMLKELDLYRCKGISDEGIESLARGCRDLEIINVAHNDQITDKALVSLSRCSRLKVLEIRGCSSISSVGLSSVAKGCRQLRSLDIKKCVNINDNGILQLAQFSQNLKQINLSYCSVTDVGVVALTSLNRLENMTILHVAGLSPSGLAAALLACRGLVKVKLHSSFRSLLPQSIVRFMETRGCVFHWRNKPFQAEVDPKGWILQFGRN